MYRSGVWSHVSLVVNNRGRASQKVCVKGCSSLLGVIALSHHSKQTTSALHRVGLHSAGCPQSIYVVVATSGQWGIPPLVDNTSPYLGTCEDGHTHGRPDGQNKTQWILVQNGAFTLCNFICRYVWTCHAVIPGMLPRNTKHVVCPRKWCEVALCQRAVTSAPYHRPTGLGF
jgi:hypothetical protein